MTNKQNYLKETVNHGDILFHLAIHHTAHETAIDIMLYTHWHEELEILYIIEGKMLLQIESQTFLVKKGDIIFIPPHTIHGALKYDDLPCAFYAIVFHPSFINSAHHDIIQQKYIEPFLIKPDKPFYLIEEQNKSTQTILHLVKTIIELYQSKSFGYEIMIKSDLLQLFFSIIQSNEIKNPEIIKIDALTKLRIKRILSFLEEHYQQTFSLKDWAQCINLSKEQFCRLFKQQFNHTPISYLIYYRLSKAADLLVHTSLPIIDIAFETGFESANYFTIAFKDKVHLTPTEYRRKHQKPFNP